MHTISKHKQRPFTWYLCRSSAQNLSSVFMVSRSSCKYSTHRASGFVLCTHNLSHDRLINQLLNQLLDNPVQCTRKLKIAHACLGMVTVMGHKQSELCRISPWLSGISPDLSMQNKVRYQHLVTNKYNLAADFSCVLCDVNTEVRMPISCLCLNYAHQRLLSS